MENQSPPLIKLDQGIHVMHLYYNLNRVAWSQLDADASAAARDKLAALCAANSAPCQPRLNSYVTLGGKADLAFMLFAKDGGELGRMHNDLELCFPAGTLERVYSYLSITELTDYASTEADSRRMIETQENLKPDTPEFEERLKVYNKKREEYAHYRLYPEMPDWEIMCFYPMNKHRGEHENWYMKDFETRKKLMGAHARTGRKFSGRISQLITGSVGLDDWEWGVTLMAHQMDAVKEIVYEMRFDEVSARFGEFGPFYISLRLQPELIWDHLRL